MGLYPVALHRASLLEGCDLPPRGCTFRHVSVVHLYVFHNTLFLFLLRYALSPVPPQAHTLGGQLEIWDPAVASSSDSDPQPASPVKPVLELWSPTHIGCYHLSSYGLLSVEAGFGDVHVSPNT